MTVASWVAGVRQPAGWRGRRTHLNKPRFGFGFTKRTRWRRFISGTGPPEAPNTPRLALKAPCLNPAACLAVSSGDSAGRSLLSLARRSIVFGEGIVESAHPAGGPGRSESGSSGREGRSRYSRMTWAFGCARLTWLVGVERGGCSAGQVRFWAKRRKGGWHGRWNVGVHGIA